MSSGDRPAGNTSVSAYQQLPELLIGVDIVERVRLRETHGRFGERFLHRVFTAVEREQAGGKVERLAGRFAAKEACAKALGTGIGKDAAWQDIEILRTDSGKPVIRLSGRAALRAAYLGVESLEVSISDTREHAVAMVAGVCRKPLIRDSGI